MKALLMALLALLPGVQGNDDKAVWRALDQSAGIPKSDAKFKYNQKTPAGARVRSVVKVPADALKALDEGAQKAIDRKLPGWTKITSPKQMRYFIVEPSTWQAPSPWREGDRTGQKCTNDHDSPGAPCLIIKGVPSAGTNVGSQQLSAVPLKDAAVVLPHQQYQNWQHRDYLVNSSWFENEHWIECQSEGRQGAACLFYQVVDDTHPHRP